MKRIYLFMLFFSMMVIGSSSCFIVNAEENADTATNELVVTGQVAENVGDQGKAEQLIGAVKGEVVEGNATTTEEIGDVVDQAAQEMEVNLSEEDRQAIIDLMEKIDGLNLNIDSLKEQASNLYDQIAGLDLNLNTSGTEHARVSFHTCPAAVDLAEVRQALAQAAPSAELFPVSADRELQYLLIMCHRAESEAVTEAVRPWSFSAVTFKELNGTAAENIARIDGELEEIRARREKTAEEITAMAECRKGLSAMIPLSDMLQYPLLKHSIR